MTIKIRAYQKKGIKCEELVDEYEFCCWQSLFNWLKGFKGLNKCPKCKKREKDDCTIICNRCGKECHWDDDGLCKECGKKEYGRLK